MCAWWNLFEHMCACWHFFERVCACWCFGFRCQVHSRRLEVKERRVVREPSLEPEGYGARESDRNDHVRERERERDWHHYSKSSARSGRSHRSSHGHHHSRRRSHSRHASHSRRRSHHSDSVGRFPKHALTHGDVYSASSQEQLCLRLLQLLLWDHFSLYREAELYSCCIHVI